MFWIMGTKGNPVVAGRACFNTQPCGNCLAPASAGVGAWPRGEAG
jgi:hypothetical protein